MTFWEKIRKEKKPFFCVAPMADVTDAAFRQMLTMYGTPDVVWTEFVSANGLASAGREALLIDLLYSEKERPIVAQLFTADPEKMRSAAKLVAERGFDGVDINMGCPDKTIEKQGAGAKMISSPLDAQKVIQAAKEGIKAAGKDIPVSVKTRIGFHEPEVDTWIPFLLEQDIAALTVHARTRKELSKVPAHWESLREVVLHRDRIAPHTVIIGNGDVTSLSDGRKKAIESGVDGVMIGRALFGNPWFFDASREVVATLPKKQPTWIRKTFLRHFFDTKRSAAQSAKTPIELRERLLVMMEHTNLFEKLLGSTKPFALMKKHFKAYCTGFPGSKELRIRLMEEAKNAADVSRIVYDFLKN